jgi:PAS domain S-box-containing protein
MENFENKNKEELQKNKPTEVKMQDEMKFNRIILELVGNPIFLKDSDHRIIFANDAFFNLFDVDENSVIGKTLAENLQENEMQQFLKIDKSVLHTGIPDIREEEVTVRGFTHTIITKKTRFIDETGNKFLVCSINDITERKEIENKLLESKNYLKLIYDTVEDIIFHLKVEENNSYRFLFVNKSFCSITGLSEEMVVGKFVKEIIPEPSLSIALNKYKQAILEKSVVKWEETSEYPKGKLIGDVSVSPVFDNLGNCTDLVGSVHNITEKREAESEKNKANTLLFSTLENMTDGFVSLDKNWNYAYVNKTAGAMLGKNPEDLIGKQIWAEFPEGINQPFYKNYYKAVETNKPVYFEDYYHPWDKWFENRVIPSKNGISIFFHDITDRKKAELALKENKDHLEELVNERTQQLEDKNKTLEKMNKLFVGREMRMAELKNQIDELKKIINN